MTGDDCLASAHLKTDIEAGLADVAAGRVKDFDVTHIIERGRKLAARMSETPEAP